MSSFKIGLIDDEAEITDLIARCLRDFPSIDVTCFSGAEDALDAIKQDRYDLVISDIRMPKLNGIEFLEWVKYSDYPPEIWFMTSYSDYTEKQLFNMGATKLIQKPFYPRDIQNLVKEACIKKNGQLDARV